MQKYVIKSFASALLVCLGTSWVHSMQNCPSDEVQQKSPERSWYVTLPEHGSVIGHLDTIDIHMSQCGVDVYYEKKSIGAKNKKQGLELLSFMRLINAVNQKYTHEFIAELIDELEECQCTERNE